MRTTQHPDRKARQLGALARREADLVNPPAEWGLAGHVKTNAKIRQDGAKQRCSEDIANLKRKLHISVAEAA